jgi:O-antigen ligase
MFQEKPILGHGDHLNTAYRKPYYARLGMVDFVRTYEAHNMYIQIAVNAGLIGLILFLSWWLWHLRFACNLIGKSEDAEVIFQTLVFWMLASLTQNSFQDSEPRYALTLLVSSLYLLGRPTNKSVAVVENS